MEHFESIKVLLSHWQKKRTEKLSIGDLFQLLNEIIFEGTKINKKKIIKSELE